MPSKPDPKSVAALLQKAVRHHQANRLVEAERAYDTILRQLPQHADALNLKGLIALGQGRIAEAVDLLGRAVKAASAYAPAFFNYGDALKAAGRSEEAIAAYRRAVAINPTLTDAYLNMGVLLDSLGKLAPAIDAFRGAARARADDARAHRNLALCLAKALASAPENERDAIATEASTAFERACTLAPADADITFEFGNFLLERNACAKAAAQFEAALKLKPDWVEALSNLGEALRRCDRFDEAVAAQRRALALRPDDTIILTHLANALQKTGAYDEAELIYKDLIAADPAVLLPYINLGNVYGETGRPNAAMALFDEALFHASDFHEAYTNLAKIFVEEGWHASAYLLFRKAVVSKGATSDTRLSLAIASLSLGRFAEGWPGYEYRFESLLEPVVQRVPPPPYWRGEDLAGKGILAWTEQGIGDEILYAQMIVDLIARGALCVIACSKRMVPIFARSFPECAAVGYEGSAAEVIGGEQFDFQSAVASLGGYLRPDFHSFPRRRGYLKSDPAKVSTLRARYEALARGRPIVGLSWRSSAPNGPKKSMALLDLAPLLSVPDVFFVNLQYGDCEADIAAVREQTGIEIFQDSTVDSLTDIDTFLAQVAAMDLVITTSSTTAHAAGAQNIPVWVMLPFAKGVAWYWFQQRSESPWYPCASLIRQPRAALGQPWWQAVVPEAARRLAAWRTNPDRKMEG